MKNHNRVKYQRGGTTPNRRGLYSRAAKFAVKAINTLVDLMENSHNDSVRIAAARALLDKSLPDLKAVEVDQDNQRDLKIVIVDDRGDDPLDSVEDSEPQNNETQSKYTFGEKQVE